jgi:hypothetical protein
MGEREALVLVDDSDEEKPEDYALAGWELKNTIICGDIVGDLFQLPLGDFLIVP